MEGNDFLTKVADKIRQAEEDKWVVPDKMRFIPIANVAKDEELKQNLAELAKKLGVDAVVMIQVDIAYKKGMSFASATPLLKSGQKLKPMISSAMVAVSKEGKAVVKTALIEPGGGTRYKGEKVWATVKNGRILLAHETGKVVSGFNAGIEIAAAGLKEELAKALSKK